jgi:hypothetical protein
VLASVYLSHPHFSSHTTSGWTIDSWGPTGVAQSTVQGVRRLASVWCHGRLDAGRCTTQPRTELNVATIKRLVAEEADVNAQDAGGGRPHWAASQPLRGVWMR